MQMTLLGDYWQHLWWACSCTYELIFNWLLFFHFNQTYVIFDA